MSPPALRQLGYILLLLAARFTPILRSVVGAADASTWSSPHPVAQANGGEEDTEDIRLFLRMKNLPCFHDPGILPVGLRKKGHRRVGGGKRIEV